MGHDGGAESKIRMYGDEDGEMDVWCIAEGKNGDWFSVWCHEKE